MYKNLTNSYYKIIEICLAITLAIIFFRLGLNKSLFRLLEIASIFSIIILIKNKDNFLCQKITHIIIIFALYVIFRPYFLFQDTITGLKILMSTLIGYTSFKYLPNYSYYALTSMCLAISVKTWYLLITSKQLFNNGFLVLDMGNQNVLAQHIMFAFSFYILIENKLKTWVRFLLTTCFVTAITTTIMTGSRISVFIIFTLIIYIIFKNRDKNFIKFIISLSSISLIVFLLYNPTKNYNNILKLLTQHAPFNARTMVWKATINTIVNKYPIFGVKNFNQEINEYALLNQKELENNYEPHRIESFKAISHCHNSYLGLIMKYGFLGFIIFVIFIYLLIPYLRCSNLICKEIYFVVAIYGLVEDLIFYPKMFCICIFFVAGIAIAQYSKNSEMANSCLSTE